MKKLFSKKLAIILSSTIICVLVVVTVLGFSGKSLKYNPNNATATNLKTISAMQDYKTNVESENAKLPSNLEDVISTITFSKAMSFDELKQYVESYDIEILQLQARGFDKSGNRTTLFSRADKGLDETFDILEFTLQSSSSDYAGIISMYALVNSNNIPSIQNDSNVFLVDTSNDEEYRKSITNIFGTKKESFSTDNEIERVFPHSVAWDAEDLGLVSYQASE